VFRRTRSAFACSRIGIGNEGSEHGKLLSKVLVHKENESDAELA